MTIQNADIAQLFNRLADLLEIEGDNPFRVRAYRNAALSINNLSKSLPAMVMAEENLTEIPGIGKDLAEKIVILVKTGDFPTLAKIEKRIPGILSDMMKIEGLGPKRVKILFENLNIKNLKDLKRAIEKGKVVELPGFSTKTVEKIKNGLENLDVYSENVRLVDAMTIAESLVAYLKKAPGIKTVEVAGSFRRRKETVNDLDILVTANIKNDVIRHFTNYEGVDEIIAKGETKATVRLHGHLRVDLRVVRAECYGAGLLYFTGSKAHNVALRALALKKELKMNEYGIFKNEKCVAGKTEASVYHQLGLSYIDPELRENQGEIEASKARKLPVLVKVEDICGDLHCHTSASDGSYDLETMAHAAQERGYEYIAITDHSQHLQIAGGLDAERILEQIKTINRINKKLKTLTLLKSVEVDILEDGRLDLPDEILRQLDFTVCSLHNKFRLPLDKQTERIIRAMDNPYFNILAHPTGRLIHKREPYAIDIVRIMQAAKDRGCFLEINAQPDRLDLDDKHIKLAKDMKLKLAISTDAHNVAQLDHMQLGVFQARRGWLSKHDVLNTLPLDKLLKLLKRS